MSAHNLPSSLMNPRRYSIDLLPVLLEGRRHLEGEDEEALDIYDEM